MDQRDLGGFTDEQQATIWFRVHQLGPLIHLTSLSTQQVADQAACAKVHPRTLRRYWHAYHRDGLIGLAPHPRQDKGSPHLLAPPLRHQIETIRLTHREAPMHHVCTLATNWAHAHGYAPPTIHQVRFICKQIPLPVLALADGREDVYRNKYKLTYPLHHPPGAMIWQMDHTQVPVLVVRGEHPSQRPWLTTVIDSASRVIMGAVLGFGVPTRFVVAAAIREALLVSSVFPFGGVPQEIWVDRGHDLVADHVQQLLGGLGITLTIGPPYQPQIRGIVERLHETYHTRLWATLPGYCGHDVGERHPNPQVRLTVDDLSTQYHEFVTAYHTTPHHGLAGQTPADFFHAHQSGDLVDIRLLDILLLEPQTRVVQKSGVTFGGRWYWHADLGPYVSQSVTIRVGPHPPAPPSIFVFAHGRLIAEATLAQPGAMTSTEMAQAQRTQRHIHMSRLPDGSSAPFSESHTDPPPVHFSGQSPPSSPAFSVAAKRVHAVLDRIIEKDSPQ